MSAKRRREDDSDSEDGDGYGFGRQQVKKTRTWFSDPVPCGSTQHAQPPRPSPTPPRIVSDIEAMTPAQSEYGELDSPNNSAYGGPVQSSQSHDYDMEMDDDFDITSQPSQSPYTNSHFLRPAMLNPALFGTDSVTPNGRIPTPIHPTFKRNGHNYPTSGSAGSLSVPASQAPISRKNTRQPLDEDRSRRMPSPISEDEDIPDTPTALTQSQLSRLSFTQDKMDTEDSTLVVPPPPTPRGRKRSGALTSVKRWGMGYREDCEKCRLGTPGHFSHFL